MPSAVQTSVLAKPPVGAPGLEYDTSFSDVVSWIATVAIPFGTIVYESAPGKATLPTATGNVTGGRTGVALIDHNKPGGYQIGDPVRVLVRGRAWALAEEAIAFGDTLFGRFAAGAGGTQLGALRNDADTASASTPINIAFDRPGSASLVGVKVGDLT